MQKKEEMTLNGFIHLNQHNSNHQKPQDTKLILKRHYYNNTLPSRLGVC